MQPQKKDLIPDLFRLTLETAPRDVKKLSLIGRFLLRRLAAQFGLLDTEDKKISFLSSTPFEMAEIVFKALKRFDEEKASFAKAGEGHGVMSFELAQKIVESFWPAATIKVYLSQVTWRKFQILIPPVSGDGERWHVQAEKWCEGPEHTSTQLIALIHDFSSNLLARCLCCRPKEVAPSPPPPPAKKPKVEKPSRSPLPVHQMSPDAEEEQKRVPMVLTRKQIEIFYMFRSCSYETLWPGGTSWSYDWRREESSDLRRQELPRRWVKPK